MNLRNYLLNRVRFGTLKFSLRRTGSDISCSYVKRIFLTFLTRAFTVWWQKDFEYYVNNLGLEMRKPGFF